MRPKLIALIAVSAVALVGCAAGETPSAPVESNPVVQSVSPPAAEVANPAETLDPNARIEKQFADFAVLRAEMHGVKEAPKASDTVEALYDLCEDGKPVDVSKSADLNENLTVIGEDAYCGRLN